MVHLPSGKFMMGDEGSQKEVVIKDEFEMGKYPVTIGEYMNFVEDTKTHYSEWLEKDNNYYKEMNLTDSTPIIGISWHDAIAYCEWLSKKTKQNYRLPTETEWEYACRAGTTTKWSLGDNEGELKDYAWYGKNSNSSTHPVGELKPNPWGLHDMHGNIWEWCEDWYDKKEKYKVLRGGSWDNFADSTRSANRDGNYPVDYAINMGFRLQRILP